jgi:hypothetical protein
MRVLHHAEDDWRREFFDIPRIPRTGSEYIEKLLAAFVNPKVSLREKKHCTLIVLKYPVSTHQLPKTLQDVCSKSGLLLKDLFSEVLLKKPEEGTSTLLSQFSRTAYRAYSDTWFRFEELLYVNHVHPAIDGVMRDSLAQCQKNIAPPRGRRRAIEERLSRGKRFGELLADSEEIHRIAKMVIGRG